MSEEVLYKSAEKKANIFNSYCLIIFSIIGIIALVLNEIGIFTLEKSVVRVAMIVLILVSSTPIIIYLIYSKALKRGRFILEMPWFKWIILIASYLSMIIVCIAISFHGTPALVIPTLMTAQYRNNKRQTIITFIASMLLIIISVYGSFLFGIYDANLLKPLTQEEAAVFDNRLQIFFSDRMLTVFFHYAFPRMLVIAAVDYIGLSISKRNTEMVDSQIELSNKIQDEILEKSKMQNSVIEHLADIIESRDLETGEHIKRTKQYVSILVNKMKDMDEYRDILTPKMCENIIHAAPLHDIGKIAVSDLILGKPGKLTDEEFEKMKVHTTKGGQIIKDILQDLGDEEFLNVAYDIAISHHEKWNGKGYPNGLKEEEIPLPGRIMAIADVFDALVSERVYKKPIPVNDAIDIILKDSGTHFDPTIVVVFMESKEEFLKVLEGVK